MKEDITDVLNAKEAAASLEAHVETIRRVAWRNKIPAFKVRKDWRFRPEALRSWTQVKNPSL